MMEQKKFGGKWQQKIVCFAIFIPELVLLEQVLKCVTQCPVATADYTQHSYKFKLYFY